MYRSRPIIEIELIGPTGADSSKGCLIPERMTWCFRRITQR
jgi:hypothetical protein